jgi:hypothetical protein
MTSVDPTKVEYFHSEKGDAMEKGKAGEAVVQENKVDAIVDSDAEIDPVLEKKVMYVLLCHWSSFDPLTIVQGERLTGGFCPSSPPSMLSRWLTEQTMVVPGSRAWMRPFILMSATAPRSPVSKSLPPWKGPRSKTFPFQ